ncbi:MAG: aminotransferase class I/II-fold pyridoxal phosphate-dependent enzyme [Clostridiales bacterium]|nr:aminotransferase class I/II-fold pyridoxal phosphate-dependent enzyme [Clostridiales bacterium]
MIDYNSILNPIARNIPSSGIRKFFGIAASRKDCLSLGVGEPDFATPTIFSRAGINSINAGKTHYTANAGLLELRQTISKYTKQFIGVDYCAEDEIVITVGASEGLDAAFRAICAIGDEILIPEPCFVCYAPLVSLCGGVPVPIDCKIENEFKLTPEELQSKITPKTKGLILAYPNNPTGAIMDEDDLRKLVPIIEKHNLIVFSDEIYGELVYDGAKFTSIASIGNMRERTIIVSGFSKYFAMTGWRLGYVCAPKEIIKIITKIHQYSVMCAPTAAQYTALEALNASFKSGFKEVHEMLNIYDERRKYILSRLNKMGLDCFTPRGAFYVFPSVKSTGLSCEEFAYALLDSKNVAVIPGSAFGSSGNDFIRISYAYSLEVIEKAFDLIEEFVKDL